MNPWLETIGVIAVAISGVLLGRFSSGLRKSYWLYGYFLSLLLISMLIVARYTNSLSFIPPLSWITAGRVKFVVLSLAITMGLTTLLPRMPHRCKKPIICILMVVFVSCFCILPFLAPALIKNNLSNIRTKIGSDGVCFQSRSYTCGPAAAVTALGKLGLKADEGEIAVLSHTNPITGTLAHCLSKALQNLYGANGLKCQYRYFDSLEQLKNAGVTLAVVKDTFLSDHCVAVLEVSDDMIKIADPVWGVQFLSHEQFEKMWRCSGIVLRRDSTQSI